jgi:hypothetical protein
MLKPPVRCPRVHTECERAVVFEGRRHAHVTKFKPAAKATEGVAMNQPRLAALRIVLIVVGLIALFAIWPLMVLWPSGWAWHTGHSDYPMMIVGIYATLGVFLLIASRNPMRHLSLIWFTVWSSIVHGVIMAVQSFGAGEHGERHLGHLLGDVPALFIVAIALAVLTPRSSNALA